MAAHEDRCPLSHGDSTSAWEQAHEALKADAALWNLLRLDGVQADGSGTLYEARTCPRCESAILKPIVREQALELCCQLAKVQAQALEALSFAPACSALQPAIPAPLQGPASP